MIYKVVQISPYQHTGIDGRKYTDNQTGIGVGLFETENSTTYKLVCVIDKNIDSPTFQASRIAELLNKNRTIFSQQEIEVKQLPTG